MCFSPLASITSFIIGILGALLCLTLGTDTDKIVAYIYGFASLLQGIEYLLWNNQTCNNINKSISLFGMILNHLQPIVLCILILVLNKSLSDINKKIILFLIFIYVIITSLYSYQILSNNECTIKNEYNHLEWKWHEMDYRGIIYNYFVFVIVLMFFLGIPDAKYGKILGFIALVTYLISFFVYKQERVIGSLWCLFSAFVPFIWFILRKTNLI